MSVVRYADRPDLLARRYEELVKPTFAAYMNENVPGNLYWGRLYTDFPRTSRSRSSTATSSSPRRTPSRSRGTARSTNLPSGWDEGFTRGMTSDRPATALMAIAISVSPERQGQQLSSRMIATFVENALAAGLTSVVAPVRPTWKERYPLVPIERYVEWRREDGTHFDPCIRIHERVGGEILAVAPEFMTINAPAADWEEWVGMPFPDDGEYVFGGLSPLVIRDGTGTHVEPNVWMLHHVAPAT